MLANAKDSASADSKDNAISGELYWPVISIFEHTITPEKWLATLSSGSIVDQEICAIKKKGGKGNYP